MEFIAAPLNRPSEAGRKLGWEELRLFTCLNLAIVLLAARYCFSALHQYQSNIIFYIDKIGDIFSSHASSAYVRSYDHTLSAYLVFLNGYISLN